MVGLVAASRSDDGPSQSSSLSRPDSHGGASRRGEASLGWADRWEGAGQIDAALRREAGRSAMTERLAASGVLRELSLQVNGPAKELVAHPAELGQRAWGGSGEQVVLAQATAEAGPLPSGGGAAPRRVPGLGPALLAADGLRALDALAERRLHEGVGIALGLDVGTPEGLGAAKAHFEVLTATRGVPFARWGSEVDYASFDDAGNGAAKVAAEAAALVELAHPGTFRATEAGEVEARTRLEGAMRAAQAALAEGRLRPANDFGWSDGWLEVFPDLTDEERHLGELPGFVPGRLDELEWQEEFPAAPPEGPQHTGHGGGLDGLGLDEPLITVPAPEELRGPQVLESRPPEPTTPPEGFKGTQERWDRLTPQERDWITHDTTANPGRTYEPLDPVPNQRTPDFLVDGVPTELKTMSGVQEPTERRLAGGIARRAMDARGQAEHVIIDARRQEGMTQGVAEGGVERAFNADERRGLTSIRVVGPDFEIMRSR